MANQSTANLKLYFHVGIRFRFYSDLFLSKSVCIRSALCRSDTKRGPVHDGVFVYINDGNANFTQDDSWIPSQDLRDFADDSAFYTWLKSIDLDTDGYEEIILDAYYVDDLTDQEQVIVEMQLIDSDLDGCDDLIIYSTDYETNSNISIFQSDCMGNLTLSQRFIISGSWTDKLHVADLNQDGLIDIYTSISKFTDLTPYVLINSGNGNFEESPFDSDMAIDIATFVVIN